MSGDRSLTLTIRRTDDEAEKQAAMDLRVRVFIDEQGVDASEEIDEHEATAIVVVAVDDRDRVVATCRLRRIDGDMKLERMAVDREVRGSGVGSELLAEAERIAAAEGAGRMVLHAQTRAQGFYEAASYEPEGDLFLEAAIEHVRMTKPLPAGGA